MSAWHLFLLLTCIAVIVVCVAAVLVLLGFEPTKGIGS